MTTIKTRNQAKARIKAINESIAIFEGAVGQLEVDGWFGGSQGTVGISRVETTVVDSIGWTEKASACADGGPVCAGIAIRNVATDRARLRRWNHERTQGLVVRHLHLFGELNDIGTDDWSNLCGIARWNDRYGVTYEQVKEAFGNALRQLTAEKLILARKYGVGFSAAITA